MPRKSTAINAISLQNGMNASETAPINVLKAASAIMPLMPLSRLMRAAEYPPIAAQKSPPTSSTPTC